MQVLINIFHFLVNLYHQVPSSAWHALFASAGVSVVLQKVKKWLSLQSPAIIHFLLIVFSFIPVAINYLMGAASTNPKVLGAQTFLILGLSNTIYRFAIKPTSNLLEDAKNERERKATQTASDASVSSMNVSSTLSQGASSYVATGSTGLAQGIPTTSSEFDA